MNEAQRMAEVEKFKNYFSYINRPGADKLLEWLEQLRQQGYETAVCWTAEEAMDTIAGYLGVIEQTGRKVEE